MTNGSVTGSASTPAVSSGPGQQNVDVPLQAAATQGQEAPTQGQEAPTQGQEDAPTQQEPPPSQREVTKRKPSRPPSGAWTHFNKEGDRASCKYCQKTYACNSASHGTSNMLKHLNACAKNPHRQADKKQKTLALGKQCENDPDNSVSFKLVEFKQEQTRLALAKMLVVDELPFKFVENEGFKQFIAEAQPRFKIPSRITIARDIMQLFNLEKVMLKSILSLNNQMVSLTTDTWTSIQNMNYMCVTAHYIDDGWELKKKILSFGLITDHKGETIGKNLEKCLKEWGIVKVCCVTVDNASSNNVAISYLVRSMCDWNGKILLNGEFMQMRCCAFILNLIVSDGLKEIDSSISRIRAACKFVKSSLARLATFKRCVQEANLASQAMVTLDVPTRWNSTFLMLDIAEKFEKAFKRLEFDDPTFLLALGDVGCPSFDDWNRARIFTRFLKIFYDATLSFSGSLHVTSNTFFKKLVDIQKSLSKWRQSDDVVLQRMTTNMQLKFIKYWGYDAINYLLLVAVFLDPRYKLVYVEFCFNRLYGVEKSVEMLEKLKEVITKLFEHYMVEHPIPPDATDSSSINSNVASQSNTIIDDGDDDEAWEDDFRKVVRKKQVDVRQNELERYMEDDVEDKTPGVEFDILKWWSVKCTKYYVLSCMARDILAVPVSTVSSESAFSTGGRVLDPFRSSLNPTTVEALICTQNWLRTPNVIDLRVEMDEVQKIESELIGLA